MSTIKKDNDASAVADELQVACAPLFAKATFEDILIDDITYIIEQNFRRRSSYNIEALAEQIIVDGGITDPLTVNKETGGDIVLARGHRRLLAAKWIREHSPNVFEEIFPDGTVPCRVCHDLSPAEMIAVRVDHTSQQPLSDAVELYRVQKAHFLAGISETRLAVIMTPLFEASLGSSKKDADVRESLKEIRACTDPKRRAQELAKKWRGRTQVAKALCSFPQYIEDAWIAQQDGKETALPRITSKRIMELKKAWNSDGRTDGPEFKALLKSYAESDRTHNGKVSKKRKSIAQSEDLRDLLRSKLSKCLVDGLNGDDEALALVRVLDEIAYYGELVQQHDSELFEKLVESGKAIATRLSEEQAASVAAEL